MPILSLSTIPGDVTVLMMQYLCARDLAALARTCKTFFELVSSQITLEPIDQQWNFPNLSTDRLSLLAGVPLCGSIGVRPTVWRPVFSVGPLVGRHSEYAINLKRLQYAQ